LSINFLCSFKLKADILGIPVDIPGINETTALGAAFLAAYGIGDFSTLDEISNFWKLSKSYEPTITEDARQSLIEQWKRAVERSKKWVE